MTVSNLTLEQKVFALNLLNISNTQFKIFFWHVRKRHYLKNKKLSVPCQTVTIEQMAQDTDLDRKTIMRFQKKMLDMGLITQRKRYHGKSRHCFNYITEYVKETWKIVEELASLGVISEEGIDKKKIKKLIDRFTKATISKS
jgi:predicted transcriptional regulator